MTDEQVNNLIEAAQRKHDENLYRILHDPHNPHAPVLNAKLCNAIRMAATPTSAAGAEYPRYLYKRAEILGNKDDDKIVETREEEAVWTEKGWSRTPSPEPPGFPKIFVEANMRSDYRKVRIRNPQELTLFQQVTNPADWVGDNQNALGGRPITVDDLASEHRAKLHQQLDEKLRNPTTSDTGEAK